LKKVMLLAAMLAMVLAATVPALAQVTQVGTGNQACVQTAIQAEVGKVQISQYGDNVNIQNIAQVCNVGVPVVEEVVASASATAAPAAVQYQYPAAAQYQYSAPASPAAELPPTGGSSLIALGAGVLLVAGGLLARRIVR
jgi:hypothetical protein